MKDGRDGGDGGQGERGKGESGKEGGCSPESLPLPLLLISDLSPIYRFLLFSNSDAEPERFQVIHLPYDH